MLRRLRNRLASSLSTLALPVAVAVAAPATGCLSNQYEIDHRELSRLARLSPEHRAKRIRVVQQTSFGADPLGPEEPMDDPGAVVVVAEGAEQPHHRHREGRPEHHASNSDGDSNRDSDDSAAALTAVAAGALLVSGAAFFIAAPTEGARFDGWASVDRQQPVMLVDHGGEGRWLTLDEMSAVDVAGADHAVFVDDSGVVRLRRAPLDRFGFASRLELGAAPLSVQGGTADYAPQVRLSFGGFPLHRLGILVGGQFAAGSVSDGGVFNGRLFGEIDWFTLKLGRFYGGLFGEIGAGTVRHDVGPTTLAQSGMTLAGGALAEIALTTRLALSLRADAASIPSLTASSSVWIPEFAVGLSVY